MKLNEGSIGDYEMERDKEDQIKDGTIWKCSNCDLVLDGEPYEVMRYEYEYIFTCRVCVEKREKKLDIRDKIL